MFECVQDCKCWLRQHRVKSSDEMCYYVDSCRDLFQSSSEQTYNQRYRHAIRKLNYKILQYVHVNSYGIVETYIYHGLYKLN